MNGRTVTSTIARVSLALIVLGFFAGATSAQGGIILTAPTLVFDVPAGGSTAIPLSVLNVLQDERELYVSIEVDAPLPWNASTPAPQFFTIPSRGVANLSFTLVAPDAQRDSTVTDIQVTVVLIDTTNGERTEVSRDIRAKYTAEILVFGVFENPLPHPLNGRVGAFALEITTWVLIGLAAVTVGDVVVRYLTRFARDDVTRLILTKYRKPIFILVILIGMKRAFNLIPPGTPGFNIFDNGIALGILFASLYLAYQLVDGFLVYYRLQIAPKTETKVDDVLVPVIRKFAAIALVIFGISQTLTLLGIDITVFVAGAGIAGIAIAFAAQDTISNFFSGIFLLVDRPFVEGDDIILESGEVVRVDHVGLRSTRFYHYRNHEVFVMPNRKLADSRITNIMRPDIGYRIMVDVGVAYGTPVDLVKEALVAAAARDPRIMQQEDVKPVVRFGGFGDNSLNFTIRCAVIDLKERWGVASDLRERIVQEFDARDIEIPFPQRTLWFGTQEDAGAFNAAVSSKGRSE